MPTSCSPRTFASRLSLTAAQRSLFCLGVDPTPAVLSAWALPQNIEGLRQFCFGLLDLVEGRLGILKPQLGYFEAFGPAGVQVLAEFMHTARAAGMIVIADAKRGDIGSTMDAYARAWLGDDAPFACDAITVSPYLGYGSLQPMIDRAVATNSGIFVVVRSSNPEGAGLQLGLCNGETIANTLARNIAASNAGHLNEKGVGPIGAVIGATLGAACADTLNLLSNAYCLVPGLGAQGASHTSLKTHFPSNRLARMVPAASRSVLMLGGKPSLMLSELHRLIDETWSLTTE